MELFTNDGISHIVSNVVISLLMDKAAEIRNRLSFARICVEVDKDAFFPSSIYGNIKGFGSIEVAAVYPWKPRHCSII